MITSVYLSYKLKPNIFLNNHDRVIQLSKILPDTFGGWKTDTSINSYIINPQEKDLIKKLYSQNLNKTYTNQFGNSVMISISYGKNQLKETQIHKPEVCYPAQGFRVHTLQKGIITSNFGSIPVMKMVAQRKSRTENVIYWIRLGDHLVRGSIEQNYTRIYYGLRGIIPDGLLFRISEIDTDMEKSFQLQIRFINDLLEHLSTSHKQQLIGNIQ